MVTANEQKAVDTFNELMNDIHTAKEQWKKDDSDDSDDDVEYYDDNNDNKKVKKSKDPRDNILEQAITLALEQGKGWKPGEKEEYLNMILDDNFIPPLFANTVKEVEDSGLQDAFTSLIYDDESHTQLMIKFRTKGNDAYTNGQRNVVKNKQYYRDAINFWYESLAWAEKIISIQSGDYAYADTDDPTYTTNELQVLKGTIISNIALAHIQLGNWGHVRDECNKGITNYDKTNIKLWYRLAKAYEKLHDYDNCGNAIDNALLIDNTNKDVIKLQKLLSTKISKARTQRQQRERSRAQRMYSVKSVWKHCTSPGNGGSISGNSNTNNNSNEQKRILLGRIPLVANVTDDFIDEDDHDDDNGESRWHTHLPHSGLLPSILDNNNSSSSSESMTLTNKQNNQNWTWPCMFVYPSHNQSDFIKSFNEYDMLAIQMAQVFPEIDDDDKTNTTNATAMPWDHNNEFVCSNLAVYFEVHVEALQQARNLLSSTTTLSKDNDEKKDGYSTDNVLNTKKNKKSKKGGESTIHHPDSVELLIDQNSCIKYYESSRALMGDEGIEMSSVVRAMEQKYLYLLRKKWKKQYKSLWNNPNSNCPIVRVHPACTLHDILTDYRMVVPNVSNF
jgi:tetratricopeptide (TPR) repeat protein